MSKGRACSEEKELRLCAVPKWLNAVSEERATGMKRLQAHGESKKHDSPVSPQRPAGEHNNKQRQPPNKKLVSRANTLAGFGGMK